MMTSRLIKFLQKNTEKIFKPVTKTTVPSKEFLKIREENLLKFVKDSTKNPERFFGC